MSLSGAIVKRTHADEGHLNFTLFLQFLFYTFYDPFSCSACTLCKFDKTGPCETKIYNIKSHLSNEGECSFLVIWNKLTIKCMTKLIASRTK